MLSQSIFEENEASTHFGPKYKKLHKLSVTVVSLPRKLVDLLENLYEALLWKSDKIVLVLLRLKLKFSVYPPFKSIKELHTVIPGRKLQTT